MADVTNIEDKRERKFVYAPDMDKLRDKIEAAQKMVEDAEEMVTDMENADDVGQRLIYLATAVRDFDRGVITAEDLQTRCTMALAQIDLESGVELLIGPLRTLDASPPTDDSRTTYQVKDPPK